MEIPGRFSLLACLFVSAIAGADVDGLRSLHEHYKQAGNASYTSVPGFPFRIFSRETGRRLSADIFSVIDRPYMEVNLALVDPVNWCKFIPLNLNIKSCIVQQHSGETILTFYVGRKYYESPESVYQLNYHYQVVEQDDHYMKVALSAGQGPLGTSDYLIVLETMPVENDTFIHIHSSYQSSMRSRLGTQFYLATLGQDKVGFSIQGYMPDGEPIYTKGVKGIVERNTMRYYLSLEAFLNTWHITHDKRFEARINNWFDLTEQHARQLHELERDVYLEAKRQEWNNQQRLQHALLGP